MTAMEMLNDQLSSGGFDEEFEGRVPVDLGDNFVMAWTSDSIALCSPDISGTVVLPWAVIEALNALWLKLHGAHCPSCGRDNSAHGNICTADDCPAKG